MTNFFKKNIIDKIINIYSSINKDDISDIYNNDWDKRVIRNNDDIVDDNEDDIDDDNEDDNENDNDDNEDDNEDDNINTQLYNTLRNNIKGIGLVYRYLLKIIILNPHYRQLCKCCITANEKIILNEYSDIYNVNSEINKTEINKTEILKINFFINKFLNIISSYKCGCNYKKCDFYTHKFYNYYDIYKIYNKIIPVIIDIINDDNQTINNDNQTINNDNHTINNDNHTINNDNHTINNDNQSINNEIIKNNKCIHNDIIKYKNYSFCKHIKYNKKSDCTNIYINKIITINKWIINNNELIKILFNKQSFYYFNQLIDTHIINNNMTNISHIDIFNKAYNIEFPLLDINIDLITVILKNDKLTHEYKKKFVHLITIRTIKQLLTTPLVQITQLCEYILETIKYNNFDIAYDIITKIDNFNKIDAVDKDKKVESIISNILTRILVNNVIDINLQIEFIKIIYKLYGCNKKVDDIIKKLIEIQRGDKIISYFKDNYNFLLHCDNYNNKKYIVKIIKKCIVYKKWIILDYLLSNINKIDINKIDINKIDINSFKIYFQVIYEESCKNNKMFYEYEYVNLLNVICKYNCKYINKSIIVQNESINNKIEYSSYLHFCIIKNYVYLAKILITNNIDIKTSLYWCIDNKNHIIFHYIIKKFNKNLINNDVITYLFNNIIDEKILLNFIDKIMIDDIDNINDIIYKIIDSNVIQYYNKIVFINKIKDRINYISCIKNNIPFILYTTTNNEGVGMYEITYLILETMIKNKKVNKIDNDFLYIGTNQESLLDICTNNLNVNNYYDKSININIIPVLIQFIKNNYKNVDYTQYTEFNIYQNEIKIYSIILIIILFVVWIVICIKDTNLPNDSKVINPTNDIKVINTTNDIKVINTTNDIKVINTTNDIKVINPTNDSKVINPINKEIVMTKGINFGCSMYREIDDYESNKVLLETEDDYKFKGNKNTTNKGALDNKDTKNKGALDNKNTTNKGALGNKNTTNKGALGNKNTTNKGNKNVKDSISNNFIDSKTLLFTDDTKFSSDIEDDDIFTIHL
jgi:hypothetical protein